MSIMQSFLCHLETSATLILKTWLRNFRSSLKGLIAKFSTYNQGGTGVILANLVPIDLFVLFQSAIYHHVV